MSRCFRVPCKHLCYEQYEGHKGRWICQHPYRRELDNNGKWTYPHFYNPNIIICETAKSAYKNDQEQLSALAKAKTPKWCYFEAVERAQRENPDFDPDRQRKTLYED